MVVTPPGGGAVDTGAATQPMPAAGPAGPKNPVMEMTAVNPDQVYPGAPQPPEFQAGPVGSITPPEAVAPTQPGVPPTQPMDIVTPPGGGGPVSTGAPTQPGAPVTQPMPLGEAPTLAGVPPTQPMTQPMPIGEAPTLAGVPPTQPMDIVTPPGGGPVDTGAPTQPGVPPTQPMGEISPAAQTVPPPAGGQVSPMATTGELPAPGGQPQAVVAPPGGGPVDVGAQTQPGVPPTQPMGDISPVAQSVPPPAGDVPAPGQQPQAVVSPPGGENVDTGAPTQRGGAPAPEWKPGDPPPDASMGGVKGWPPNDPYPGHDAPMGDRLAWGLRQQEPGGIYHSEPLPPPTPAPPPPEPAPWVGPPRNPVIEMTPVNPDQVTPGGPPPPGFQAGPVGSVTPPEGVASTQPGVPPTQPMGDVSPAAHTVPPPAGGQVSPLATTGELPTPGGQQPHAVVSPAGGGAVDPMAATQPGTAPAAPSGDTLPGLGPGGGRQTLQGLGPEPPEPSGPGGSGGGGGGGDGGGAPGGGALDNPAHNAADFERLKADLARQELEGAPVGGTALEHDDPMHRVASFTTDLASQGQHTTIVGGDGIPRNLVQVEGEVNGQPGIFEWIVDEHGVRTHQRFIPGGVRTGTPNQVPGRLPEGAVPTAVPGARPQDVAPPPSGDVPSGAPLSSGGPPSSGGAPPSGGPGGAGPAPAGGAGPAPAGAGGGGGPGGGGPGGGGPGRPDLPGPEDVDAAFENRQLGPFVQAPAPTGFRVGAGQGDYWGAEPATGMTVQEYRFPAARGMPQLDAAGNPVAGPPGDVQTRMRIHSPDATAPAGAPAAEGWTVGFEQRNARMTESGDWFDTRFAENPAGGRVDLRPYRRGPDGRWVDENNNPVADPGTVGALEQWDRNMERSHIPLTAPGPGPAGGGAPPPAGGPPPAPGGGTGGGTGGQTVPGLGPAQPGGPPAGGSQGGSGAGGQGANQPGGSGAPAGGSGSGGAGGGAVSRAHGSRGRRIREAGAHGSDLVNNQLAQKQDGGGQGPSQDHGAGGGAGGAGAGHDDPNVEKVNPKYPEPPGTPAQLKAIQGEIENILAARAQAEEAEQRMAHQEQQHQANKGPIQQAVTGTQGGISAVQAHKEAVANREQANKEQQQRQQQSQGLISGYPSRAAGIAALQGPLHAFQGFTHLASLLPGDIGAAFHKMSQDADHLDQAFNHMNSSMEQQNQAQPARQQELQAHAGQIQATGQQANASQENLQKANQGAQVLQQTNEKKVQQATAAKAQATEQKTQLADAAAKKQQQHATFAEQMQAWAQAHKAARDAAIEETKKKGEAEGKKVKEVKEK